MTGMRTTDVDEVDPAAIGGCGPGRGDARQQAILDAAVELVAEVGYDRMSMDAIALRARASKATMYRHWPGKAELVTEAFRRRSCPDMACPPDTGSLRGDLAAVVHDTTIHLCDQDGPLLAGMLTAIRQDPVLAGLVRAQIDQKQRDIGDELVRRAHERGEVIVAGDVPFILALGPAAILTRSLLMGVPVDDAFERHLVDDVLLPLLTGAAVPAA